MKSIKTGILVLFLMVPFLASAFDLKSDYDILVEESQENTANNVIDVNDLNYEQTPFNKLGRGAFNVLGCWGEIFAEFFNVSREKDPLSGATIGLAQGMVIGLYRGGTGLYDILTFPYPPYDKPPMRPEYPLQSADEAFEGFTAKSRLFGD